MAAITGANMKMGACVATVWNTPVAAIAGDGLIAEATPNFGVSTLQARSIGSGKYMQYDATRGNFIPTVSLVGDCGYHNNWPFLLAAAMGTSAAPTEVTPSQGDYKHTITLANALTKYITLAYQDSSATSIEFPTCVATQWGISASSAIQYLEWTMELLAGTVNFSSTTNDFSDLSAVTILDEELIRIGQEDLYRMNDASAGALAGGDQTDIVSFDFNMQRPQEIITEIKAVAANGVPNVTDIVTGQFNCVVKSLVDHTRYTEWSAETTKKAYVDVQGTLIAAGTNKTLRIYMPSMKLVTEPQYAPTSPGINQLSLSFELLERSANPTGFSNTRPYFELTNTLATSLLA